MSHPVPSTFDTYKPGIGFTITRANIDAYQAALVEADKPVASPSKIVMAFATPVDQKHPKLFIESKSYKRRLARAVRIMNRPKPAKMNRAVA